MPRSTLAKRRDSRPCRAFAPTAKGAQGLEPRIALSSLPAGFSETVVASGFQYPGSMTIAPDGRIFVLERAGTIRIIKDGRTLDQPFATLPADNTVSQGLMGLAFDPDFPAAPYAYVYYVSPQGGLHNVVSRLTVDGDSVVPGSERMIFRSENYTFPAGTAAHNGGAIDFGPDKKLYISTGDMLIDKQAQKLDNSFGKILRLNADGTIPRDNPFFRRGRGLGRAIWAYGLRNPFTMTFQPGTGRLFINDVGAGAFEEINLGAKGANFGWPRSEGPTRTRGVRQPIYAYSHREGGRTVDAAVIGGAFYDAPVLSFPPQYHGKYFFSDYAQNFLRTIDPQTHAVAPFGADLGAGVVDIEIDAQGRLYYLTIGDGAVHVIQYAVDQPPSLTQPLKDALVPKYKPATLSVSPQGSYPFTIQWFAGGHEIAGATSSSLSIPADQIDPSVAYHVVITNAFGTFTSNIAYASSTNDAEPTATILSPAKTARFRVGQIVNFAGMGSDDEAPGGRLPDHSLAWQVDLLHDGHVHPKTYSMTGVATGSFKIPKHDDPGKFALRLTLTVTDDAGQSASESITIDPATSSRARRRRRNA